MKYILLFLMFITLPCFAETSTPLIGIIIDDMGNHATLDSEVVNLPGAVTCSVMPYTYFGPWIADKAHAANKEVLAHIPMQALGGETLGQGGLTVDLDQAQFDQILIDDLKAVPYAEGLNNHMGSLLTEKSTQMNWLMQAIQPTGLLFVDSRTSGASVAEKIAILNHVPTISRDVFLDNVQTESAISEQFAQLIAIARTHGMALAIGHPYPATIRFLQSELPTLSAQGVQLIPLSQMITDREFSQKLMPSEYYVPHTVP